MCRRDTHTHTNTERKLGKNNSVRVECGVSEPPIKPSRAPQGRKLGRLEWADATFETVRINVCRRYGSLPSFFVCFFFRFFFFFFSVNRGGWVMNSELIESNGIESASNLSSSSVADWFEMGENDGKREEKEKLNKKKTTLIRRIRRSV